MNEAHEIVEFIYQHGDGLYTLSAYADLLKAVDKHLKYKTIVVLRDNKGITAIVRYNWQDKSTIFVIDAITRKDKRSARFMYEVMVKGLNTVPNCKYIWFHRGKRKMNKLYNVNTILKRRK